MPIVTMPDGTRVRFPDDMSQDQIRSMILKKFPDAGSERGNIDLSKRKGVPFEGGTATVRSISIEQDGKHYLIPTVVGDKVVSNEEAVAQFRRTGEHLGVFRSREAADQAGERIHQEEAQRIRKNEVGGTAYQVGRGVVQGAIYDPVEGIGQIIEHATGKKIPIPQSVRNWFDKVRENTEATGTGTAARIGGAVGSALVAPELAIGQAGRLGALAGTAARARAMAAPTMAELRAVSTSRAGEKAAELIPKYQAYAKAAGKSAMDLTQEERVAARLGQMPPGPPSRLGAFGKRAAVGAGVGAVQPVDPGVSDDDFAAQKGYQALAGGSLGALAGAPIGGPLLRHIGRHRWHYGPTHALGTLLHPATALPSLAILSGLAAQYGLEKAGPMIAGPLGAVAGQAMSGKPPEEAPNAESQ